METIKIEPFKIIGIAIRTTNEKGQGAQDIGGLWGKFISENILDAIPDKVDDTVYSLYTEYESDYTGWYTTIIGCKVKTLEYVPDSMVGKSFTGGKYLQKTIEGDLAKGIVAAEWHKIWAGDLDRTYLVDFEVYGKKAKDMHNATLDILVGIK